MIIDLDPTPVSQILLQMTVRAEIMVSLPFLINSARMLSAPCDFPPFRYVTAASTSSLRMRDLLPLVF